MQDNPPLTILPTSLAACGKLKRVNLSNLGLDATSLELTEKLKKCVLSATDGIWWGPDGKRCP